MVVQAQLFVSKWIDRDRELLLPMPRVVFDMVPTTLKKKNLFCLLFLFFLGGG